MYTSNEYSYVRGPLRECLWARRLRPTLLLYTNCVRFDCTRRARVWRLQTKKKNKGSISFLSNVWRYRRSATPAPANQAAMPKVDLYLREQRCSCIPTTETVFPYTIPDLSSVVPAPRCADSDTVGHYLKMIWNPGETFFEKSSGQNPPLGPHRKASPLGLATRRDRKGMDANQDCTILWGDSFPGSYTCVLSTMYTQVELDRSTWQIARVELTCHPRLRSLFKPLDRWQFVKSTCQVNLKGDPPKITSASCPDNPPPRGPGGGVRSRS